uniref:Uncharacterized protein n=1 Tax=Kalanchoe fedtschenkoi TaxID=63787 RepID=A0A7N0UDF5_KALFE
MIINKLNTLTQLTSIIDTSQVMDSKTLTLLLLISSWLHILQVHGVPAIPKQALPTLSGYLPVTSSSAMYYAYYEAQNPIPPLPDTPILIWLQGGFVKLMTHFG